MNVFILVESVNSQHNAVKLNENRLFNDFILKHRAVVSACSNSSYVRVIDA